MEFRNYRLSRTYLSAACRRVRLCRTPRTHLLHQQRAMHEHGNQPYRRLRDDAVVTERALWAADDASVAGRRDVGFRVGR